MAKPQWCPKSHYQVDWVTDKKKWHWFTRRIGGTQPPSSQSMVHDPSQQPAQKVGHTTTTQHHLAASLFVFLPKSSRPKPIKQQQLAHQSFFLFFSLFLSSRSTIEHGTSSQYCLFCICVGKFRSPWGLNSGPATKILNPLNTLWMPGLPPTLS